MPDAAAEGGIAVHLKWLFFISTLPPPLGLLSPTAPLFLSLSSLPPQGGGGGYGGGGSAGGYGGNDKGGGNTALPSSYAKPSVADTASAEEWRKRHDMNVQASALGLSRGPRRRPGRGR